MIKVLIVEDDASLRRIIADVLETSGNYEIEAAVNGADGLQKARKYLPDLIVCDVEMPEMDGFQLLETVRQEEALATTPFIFLTARADREANRQGMSLGADDYITKPFTAAELLTAVETRLAKMDQITDLYEEKIDELRGNILLALPHELRTPLSLILGYSDLMQADAGTLTTAELETYARSIHNATRRLYHLIENYLIYAQLETAVAMPSVIADLKRGKKAAVDAILGAVVARYRREQDHAITLTLGANAYQVPMHPDYLEKIVDELISNAVKFSTEGQPVTVSSAVVNDQVQVAIHNKGRGMTPAQIKEIGPYMQFGRRVYEQQGSGFGLAIARRLTELHDGTLHIDSEPGVSITVTVAFPL